LVLPLDSLYLKRYFAMSSHGNKNNGNNKTDAGDKGGSGKKTSTTGGGADGGLVPTNKVNLQGAWAKGPPVWNQGDLVRASKHCGLGPSSDDGKSEDDSERDVDSTTAKTNTSHKRSRSSEVDAMSKRQKRRRSPRKKKGKRNFSGGKTAGLTKKAACGGNDNEAESPSSDSPSSDGSSSDGSSSDSSYREDDNTDGEVTPNKKKMESDDSGSESDGAQNKAAEAEQPGETVAAAAAVPPAVLIGGVPPAGPEAAVSAPGADPAADLTSLLALLAPGSVVIQGPIEHNNIRGWLLEAVRLLIDQEAVPVPSGKALYGQLVKYISGKHVRSDGRLNKSFLEGLRDSGSTMAEWAYLDDGTRRVQHLVDQATAEGTRRAEQSGRNLRSQLVKYEVQGPEIDKLVNNHVEQQLPKRLAAAFAKITTKLQEVEIYLRLNGVTEKHCTDGKHWRTPWDDADRGDGGAAGGAGMAA
jgi:hypothetical protein